MKRCGYCGRDNGDAATRCAGCGTEFVTAAAAARKPWRPPKIRDVISAVICCLSLFQALLTIGASLLWVNILMSRSGAGFLTFTLYMVPLFGLSPLLLTIIPSRILYRRGRRRQDLFSFWLALSSSLLLVLEVLGVWLWVWLWSIYDRYLGSGGSSF